MISATTTTTTSMYDAVERPKSRKESRLEKKAAAAKKKADDASSAIVSSSSVETKNENENENEKIILEKSEYRRLKKIKQKELQKEKEKLERKEIREEQKIRKRKKLHREINAPGGGGTAATAASKKRKKAAKLQQQHNNNNNDTTTINENERDVSMDVFQSVFQGSKTNEKGITTTRLGVQYKDIVIGKGEVLKEGIPIICKYELTGGRFGAVIDSSKRFQFRLGMGEVIQGWDIGLEGMKVGGRRKLIVPPKAGYGGKDIGAGPGGILYFDISILVV